MEYIVKDREITMPFASPVYYDVFTVDIVKDITGKDVSIPRIQGSFTLEQLEAEKQLHLNRIEDIDNKILSINSFILAKQ